MSHSSQSQDHPHQDHSGREYPSQGHPRAEDTAHLKIDLDALKRNYNMLRLKSAPAECSAVIKSNGYGLGLEQVARALLKAGCTTFFVATIGEGARLRKVDGACKIYILNGLLPNTASLFAKHKLTPVLNSVDELIEWQKFAANSSPDIMPPIAPALHIDTGMNRLGLSGVDFNHCVETGLLGALPLSLVMSHLACADDPTATKNEEQRRAFEKLRQQVPHLPASLANSAGVFLGADYHYQLTRPGIALYGASPFGGQQSPQENPPKNPAKNLMENVITLEARIVQIREAQPGDTVSYGVSFEIGEAGKLAIIALGYGDGYPRLLGSSYKPEENTTPPAPLFGGEIYIAGQKKPIIGRVTMDLIIVDVSDIPANKIRRGDFVEVIGPHILLDDVAQKAQTIGYEILTQLGARAYRSYVHES